MNAENLPQIPLDEIEAQFRAFMRDNNCEPLDNISLEMDGTIKRYRVFGDTKSEKTGAYFISLEGYPHGWCQNWREGNVVKWTLDRGKLKNNTLKNSLTDDVISKMIEASKTHQAEMQKKLHAIQAEASERARILFEQTPPDEKSLHEYLIIKKISASDVHVDKSTNKLLVPLRDIDGNFKSLQWIDNKGGKKFFPDAPVKGACFSMGAEKITPDNADKITIFVCEGVATCCTIYYMTDMPTFAAMTCRNIFDVAQALKSKYPKHKIVIMADNDHKTQGNPGISAANKAKNELDLYGIIYPDFQDYDDGTDWNDYYIEHGIEDTKNLMRQKYAEITLIARTNKYKTMASEYGVMAAEKFDSFCIPSKGDNFIIQDWIPNKSLIMLFAPSGSGKGFIAIDMSVAIACNDIETWHGKKIIRHGPVVYLAGEGQEGMRKRCAGLSDYKGINRENIQTAIIKEALDIDNKDKNLGINKVIANIGINYPNPVLVILDTLNCYMGGDENKTVDATAFIKAGKEIVKEFNCSVMIIHHTGLNADNKGRVRGSSVFKAAMDMELNVEQTGMALTLKMTKSKDTEIQKPLVFEMIQIPVEGFYNSLGFQETTCVLELNAECHNDMAQETTVKKEKITEAERFAKNVYKKAACEFGMIIHDEEMGNEFIAVNPDDWRKTFMLLTKATTESSKRAQYSKARKLMLDKKILFEKEVYEQIYDCLTPSDDSYESSIRINIMKRQDTMLYV